ncbi:alpha/beta hydrolase [Pelomyxa schiedti]|nr:alpha/beta hydrolase [Pelomyxa schiedti]
MAATHSEEFFGEPGHRTSYSVHGSDGGKVVLCIHGLTQPSFVFDYIKEVLVAAGFRVVLFDLYGRGNSDSPPETYDDALFVGQAVRLLDHLHIAKATVIGFSLGGAITASLCLHHPSRIERLVFIGTAGMPFDMRWSAWLYSWLMYTPLIGPWVFNTYGKDAMLSRLRTYGLSNDFKNLPPDELSHKLLHYTEWAITEKDGFLNAFYSTMCYFPLQKLSPAFASIPKSTPVLVIWGAQDQTVPPQKPVAALRTLVPHATVHVIEDAGHTVLLEKPDIVNGLILSFLQSPTSD